MKKSTLLWGFAALLGLQASAETIAPASTSPENFSVFLEKTEGVPYVDILFDGAQSVSVNEEVNICVNLASSTGALPTSTSSLMFSSVTTTPIEGGARISLVGKGTYYGEDKDWFSVSASTNFLTLNIPEGYLNVVGTDGVTRQNEPIALYYGFDKARKAPIVSLPESGVVTPGQLAELVFGEGTELGSSPLSNTAIRLYQPGATYGSAWKIVANDKGTNGYFVPQIDDNGILRAAWNGNPYEIKPGNYRIVVYTRQTLKYNGVEQYSQWTYPITVTETPSTGIQLVLARDEKLEGAVLPRFLVYAGSATLTPVEGTRITATIDCKSYDMQLASDGVLTFTEADAAEIVAAKTNTGYFNATITIPAKSIIIEKGGERFVNNAAEEQFTIRLYTPIAPDEIYGEYFVKRLAGVNAGCNLLPEGEFNLYGHSVAISACDDDEPAMGDNYIPVAINGFPAEGLKVVGQFDPSTRRIDFYPQYVGDELLFTDLKSPLANPIVAPISGSGSIEFNNWTFFNMEEMEFYLSDTECALVRKIDDVVPAAPVVAARYDVASGSILATVTLPEVDTDGNALPDLTAVNVTANGTPVFFSNAVAPGCVLNFVAVEQPVSGTRYDLVATVSLCSAVSEASEPASVFYSPITDVNEVLGEYFVTEFEGGSTHYDFTISRVNLNSEHIFVRLSGLATFITPVGELDPETRTITLSQNGVLDPENENDMGYTTNPMATGLTILTSCDYIGSQPDMNNAEPVVVTLGENGTFDMPNWSVLLAAQDKYTVRKKALSTKAVKNEHILPGTPTVELSVITEGETYHINGTVTLADTDADGRPVNPATSGHNNIHVYRAPDAQPTAIGGSAVAGLTSVRAFNNLQHGETVTFTDENVGEGVKTYVVFVENLNNVNYDAPGRASTKASGIQSAVDAVNSGNAAVYNLQGVKVAEGLDALRTLAPGVYIVNGVKTIIRR